MLSRHVKRQANQPRPDQNQLLYNDSPGQWSNKHSCGYHNHSALDERQRVSWIPRELSFIWIRCLCAGKNPLIMWLHFIKCRVLYAIGPSCEVPRRWTIADQTQLQNMHMQNPQENTLWRAELEWGITINRWADYWVLGDKLCLNIFDNKVKIEIKNLKQTKA